MKQLVAFYQKYFSIITTLSVSIFIAAITEHIPYLKAAPHFFSTIILTASLFVLVTFLKDKLLTNLRILVILVGIAFILDVLTFSFQSEIAGNLFYILLFYVTIKEALKTASK